MEDYFKRQQNISFIDNNISGSEKFKTLIISMILAVCMDRFFVDKYWGVSVPIFTSVALAFFLWSTRDIEKKTNGALDFRRDTILKIAIISSMALITFTFVLFSNIILAFFNTIFIISAFTAYAILNTNREDIENTSFLRNIIKRLIPRTFKNFSKPFMFLNELIKNMGKIEVNSELSKVLKGVVLALPILVVILILLSSADMIFNYYLSSMFGIFNEFQLSDLGVHLIIIILFFFYIFGFIWSFKYEKIYEASKTK
jgi:hypothetical protein